MLTQEEIAKLHREAEIELKKYPGVVGVGYGFKKRGGVTTDEIAFTAYVVEKKSRAELTPDDVIPPTYKGIPTDVLKVPRVADLHCEDMDHHSPLIGGISISTYKPIPGGGFATGTLGCFATINGVQPPENVVLVTNNHVILKFGEKVGDRIFQPKFQDVGGTPTMLVDEDQAIGKIHNAGLKGNHPFTFPGEAPAQYGLDCATAKLNISISSCCHTNCGVHFKNEVRGLNINGNNFIADIANVRQSNLTPGSDYVVFKAGRTTSRTVGKVTDVAAPFPDGRQNVIVIEATQKNCNNVLQFGEEGDSGAALINADNKIVGILMAKDLDDPKIAYACHIAPVINKLGITIITRANPHPVADTVLDVPGVIRDGGTDYTPRLKEKLLSTERGREVFELVQAHRLEVLELVNHRRPVTVVWHRSKGPAFVAHVLNNARDPDHAIPREIEGVTREALIRNMARALEAHGSPELKALVERNLVDALSRSDAFDSLHEIVERLEDFETVPSGTGD